MFLVGTTGKVGAKYNVSLKYRSGTSFIVRSTFNYNYNSSAASTTSANTGNAITYNTELTHTDNDLYSFAVIGQKDGLTGPIVWIEVDEIYVYEVIEYH